MDQQETVMVTTSAARWLAAIDELGWRRAGPGTANINWLQVQMLIDAVRVLRDGGDEENG